MTRIQREPKLNAAATLSTSEATQTEQRPAGHAAEDRYLPGAGPVRPILLQPAGKGETQRRVLDVITMQAAAVAKGNPKAAVDQGQAGWAVFGRDPNTPSMRYDGLDPSVYEFTVLPTAEEASRARKAIIKTTAEVIDLPDVDAKAVEALAASNIGIAPVNVLKNAGGDPFFADAKRLRDELADPKTAQAAAEKKQFAVLYAAFGSGAYGFSGPEAYFRGEQPMNLADAQKSVAQLEDGGYGGHRIVPASLMRPELIDFHGPYLDGTNHPSNELQRYMAADGDLNRLTVMIRSKEQVEVRGWKPGQD